MKGEVPKELEDVLSSSKNAFLPRDGAFEKLSILDEKGGGVKMGEIYTFGVKRGKFFKTCNFTKFSRRSTLRAECVKKRSFKIPHTDL